MEVLIDWRNSLAFLEINSTPCVSTPCNQVYTNSIWWTQLCSLPGISHHPQCGLVNSTADIGFHVPWSQLPLHAYHQPWFWFTNVLKVELKFKKNLYFLNVEYKHNITQICAHTATVLLWMHVYMFRDHLVYAPSQRENAGRIHKMIPGSGLWDKKDKHHFRSCFQQLTTTTSAISWVWHSNHNMPFAQ